MTNLIDITKLSDEALELRIARLKNQLQQTEQEAQDFKIILELIQEEQQRRAYEVSKQNERS